MRIEKQNVKVKHKKKLKSLSEWKRMELELNKLKMIFQSNLHFYSFQSTQHRFSHDFGKWIDDSLELDGVAAAAGAKEKPEVPEVFEPNVVMAPAGVASIVAELVEMNPIWKGSKTHE